MIGPVAGAPHAVDGLGREADRPALGGGRPAAQAVMQHLGRAGAHRQQRMIAAHPAVGEAAAAMLVQPIRLADGGIDVDRHRVAARTRAGGPGATQQLAADHVELACVAPRERTQEGAHRRRRGDAVAEHGAGGAGAQGVDIVDAVTAGQGAHDQGQALVGHMRLPGGRAEVDVVLEQLGQAQPAGQAGRRQQPGIGDQARVVEGRALDGKGVRSWHRTGVLRLSIPGSSQPQFLSSDGHLFGLLSRRSTGQDRWIRA